MPYQPNHPAPRYLAPMYPAGGMPGVPRQPGPPPGRRKKQVVLNILSILIVLVACYEVLGISDLTASKGMSNDDAVIAAGNSAWKLFFDPLGFALLLGLLVSAFVIHQVSKSMPEFSNAATLTGLILTGLAFLLSLFRVSIIFPLMFGSLGMAANEQQNGPDVRIPAAREFVLDPAQLIQYQDASGVRIATAVANNSPDSWETANVAITYADAVGTVCGTDEQVEEYIAPGEQRAITTQFLSAAIYYNDPSCVPVTATAELVQIDVDSRSEIPPADYAGTVPVFDSLMTFEDPGIDGSSVRLSVVGTVAPGSMGTLPEDTRLPVGFEVADQQGLRLSWCFDADEVGPDGSFRTHNFHSPLPSGAFHTVAVVPGC